MPHLLSYDLQHEICSLLCARLVPSSVALCTRSGIFVAVIYSFICIFLSPFHCIIHARILSTATHNTDATARNMEYGCVAYNETNECPLEPDTVAVFLRFNSSTSLNYFKENAEIVKMRCLAGRRSWLCIFIINIFSAEHFICGKFTWQVSRISSSSEFRREKNGKRFSFPLGCCIGRIQLRRASAQSLWDANLRPTADSIQLKWQNANFYGFIRRFVECVSR